MTQEQSNVITIEGKEYKQEDLNDQQNYAIAQIRDLQTKANDLKFQLDQVQASLDAFTNALIASVKEEQVEEAAAS
tara:strand:- start:54 stop:281 length:228 start_codon:yes stop_codon:yes gene_type:complete